MATSKMTKTETAPAAATPPDKGTLPDGTPRKRAARKPKVKYRKTDCGGLDPTSEEGKAEPGRCRVVPQLGGIRIPGVVFHDILGDTAALIEAKGLALINPTLKALVENL